MNRFFFVALLALSPVLSVQADASSRSQESAATATAQVTLPAGEWGTQIDYDYSVERPDQLSQVARNGEVSRLSFATLQRSFGTGNFRPYLGVGVGQASARFEAVERGAQDSLALKGVVGGRMDFSDEVGGYVQYDYAVASENPVLAEEDASHGIRLGLSIALN